MDFIRDILDNFKWSFSGWGGSLVCLLVSIWLQHKSKGDSQGNDKAKSLKKFSKIFCYIAIILFVVFGIYGITRYKTFQETKLKSKINEAIEHGNYWVAVSFLAEGDKNSKSFSEIRKQLKVQFKFPEEDDYFKITGAHLVLYDNINPVEIECNVLTVYSDSLGVVTNDCLSIPIMVFIPKHLLRRTEWQPKGKKTI